MVTPNDAREPASLADANNVDIAFAIENFYQNLVANLHCAVSARCTVAALGRLLSGSCRRFRRALHCDFTNELHWWQVVLSEMALHRLADILAFYKLHQPDLRRLVAIFICALELRDYARPGLQN